MQWVNISSWSRHYVINRLKCTIKYLILFEDLRILAGKQWLKTDANIKRPLQIAYYTELEQYNKELYEYQQSLDEEQLSEGKLHKTKELQGKKYRNFLEQVRALIS